MFRNWVRLPWGLDGLQVRMAALAKCGSHAVLDAELGGCRTGELTLAARLVRSVGPDMLVLADREFLGVPLWRAFTGDGAHLLWRVSANRVLPVQVRLPDGSWLSRLHAGTDGKKRDPVRVRVIATLRSLAELLGVSGRTPGSATPPELDLGRGSGRTQGPEWPYGLGLATPLSLTVNCPFAAPLKVPLLIHSISAALSVAWGPAQGSPGRPP